MPSNEEKLKAQNDAMINAYQEIVSTLIRSLTRVPGFPPQFREPLYANISHIHKINDIDELTRLSKSLEKLCSTAVAEIGVQSNIKEQEQELERIVAMLGESISTVIQANDSTGNKLDSDLGSLQQAIIEDGEPIQFSKKIEVIAHSIRETTSLLKQEVEQSRTQAKEAGQKIQVLEQELQQTKAESLKDGLTNLHNRRSFNQFIKKALSSYDPKSPWSIIILDVDHFKAVNDTHGHVIGDALLIKLSRTLREQVQHPMFLARYGGEEFVILLPRSPLDAALDFCDTLLDRIRAARWQYRTQTKQITINATVSAGVAEQKDSDTPENLVNRADRALYLAKENGRNRFYSERDVE